MSVPDDALLAEIECLLARDDAHDDPDELAQTLTDGYARALGLEAERVRLERQLTQLAATIDGAGPADVSELSAIATRIRTQEGALAALRRRLELLRARHSFAARVPAR